MTGGTALAVYAGATAALAIDLVVVVRLVMLPVESLAASAIAHAACAVAGGALLSSSTPPFLRATRASVGIFVGVVAFFIPVLGLAGSIAVLTFGLREPQPPSGEPWVVHDAAADLDAHHRRTVRTVQRRRSAPDIGAVLRRRQPEHAAERFRAVLATKHLPARLAVPLLKQAQRDPSDEVRLYAFSRLEGMRDEIEKRIDALHAALDDAGRARQALVQLRLAESYWELGSSGLAEGAVRSHALGRAEQHAGEACVIAPGNAAAEVLRGRVLLELRDPERAAAAFDAAMRAGYPRGRVLAFIADCAFQRRDFAGVRAALAELEASPQHGADVRDVLALWLHDDASRPARRPPPALTEQTL